MIPYIGGKFFIADWIISQFPYLHSKSIYVEVFGGAGWVLQKKPRMGKEVYNDLNGDIVNLFTVIRDDYDEFKERYSWVLHSRQMYCDAEEKVQKGIFRDRIDRAIQVAIRHTQGFSGSGTKKSQSGWSFDLKTNHTHGQSLKNRLRFVHDRFVNVQIDCLDFEKCIRRYDSEDTFFYLDPPYLEKENYYKGFTFDDHKRLCELLRETKGKWLLSYYPHHELDKYYEGYRRAYKQTVKHSQKSKVKDKAIELLIMNYNPSQQYLQQEFF